MTPQQKGARLRLEALDRAMAGLKCRTAVDAAWRRERDSLREILSLDPEIRDEMERVIADHRKRVGD